MRIKELRMSRNLTQQKLADILGVSRSALASWESGVNYPEVSTLEKIADFFSVSTDFILERDGSKEIPAKTSSVYLEFGSDSENKYNELLRFADNYTEDDVKFLKIYKTLDPMGKRKVMATINKEVVNRTKRLAERLEKNKKAIEESLRQVFEVNPFAVEDFWGKIPMEYIPNEFRPDKFTPPSDKEFTVYKEELKKKKNMNATQESTNDI